LIALISLLLGRWAALQYFEPRGTPFDLPAPASLLVHGINGDEHEVKFHGRRESLVILILSAECRFCDLLAPEWKRFTDRLDLDTVELALFSRSDVQGTSRYVTQWGLRGDIWLIESEDLNSLGASGYPITILVEPESQRLTMWTGMQPPATFDEILGRIQEGASNKSSDNSMSGS
jgi:hypothetical protein